MDYLDSSVIVAALCREPATGRIQHWLADCEAGDLAISDWTMTEVSSALAVKLRTGQIALEQRSVALAAFHRIVADSLSVLPVTAGQFRTAAHFADQYMLGLRAGDALHLAIAAESGAMLVTLDQRMADAAPHFGIPVRTLS